MKKKTIVISLVGLVLVFLVGYLFVCPKILFSMEYEAPKGLTAEETIEKYFEYIEDGNPARANTLCVKPILTVYSCNTAITAKANSIEDWGHTFNYEYKDSYDYREYFVDYTCRFLIDNTDRPFWNGNHSIFFAMVKETEDSDWQIADIHTGP